MKLHMEMAKELEANFPGFTVGAPHVTVQMLAFPEYGYVKKPLNMLVYGMGTTWGGIKNYTGLQNLDITRTIWIGFKSDLPDRIVYPIDPKDRIVKEIIVGDKKATLFMGGIAIEKMYRIIMLKKFGAVIR